MDLLRRPTTLADFEECFAITRNGYAFSADEKMAMQELWCHLFQQKICLSSVLEDTDFPGKDRIVAFGLSAFAKKPFIDEAATSTTPFIIQLILEGWHRGHNPFLSHEQIRHANSNEGLCGVTIQYGYTKSKEYQDESAAIRRKLVESLINTHIGYRLNRYLHEVYGEAERNKLLSTGCSLENDYAGFFVEGFSNVEDYNRPFLMNMQRHEVLKNEFSPLYPLFNYRPPQFYLRESQQALLKLALLGKSDAQCADELDITIDTVHKRWRAIYERVAEIDPGFIHPIQELKRGTEKRSTLLRYLQAHPEELRPLTHKGRTVNNDEQ